MADHRDGTHFPLTTKLLTFYQGLPPGQQAVMATILGQAGAGGAIRGYGVPADLQEAVDDALQQFTQIVAGDLPALGADTI